MNSVHVRYFEETHAANARVRTTHAIVRAKLKKKIRSQIVVFYSRANCEKGLQIFKSILDDSGYCNSWLNNQVVDGTWLI